MVELKQDRQIYNITEIELKKLGITKDDILRAISIGTANALKWKEYSSAEIISAIASGSKAAIQSV